MSLWPDDSEDEYAPSLPDSEVDARDAEDFDDVIAQPGFASHEPGPEGAEGEAYRSEASGSFSSESIADDGEELRRRRKRRRLSLGFPQGRPPFKRVQGPFSLEYMGLLNDDIDDAKERIIADPEHVGLPDSRVGMVIWTAAEKRLFFDAAGRLGKDDLPGISSLIGTKTIVEVAHYIHLLEEGGKERFVKSRDLVVLAEIPAAAEISPQCCLALDAAADELSLRQQRYEEQREKQKWAAIPWNVTREAAIQLETVPEDERPAFANLFNPPAWVKLSNRVFMNASFAENNWRYVDEEPPSMRATAFEDFHNLAVSITRKIISTVLFFADSRIRAKTGADRRTRRLVKRRDVLAAVESLGLAHNSHDFWAGCARRLKLDVYDDEDEGDPEDGLAIMSFNEVEAALGHGESSRSLAGQAESRSQSEDEESVGDDDTDSPDTDIESAEAALDAADEAMEGEFRREIPDEKVRDEAQELIHHTALDIPPTQRSIEAVMRRIIAERNNEAHADACDLIASAEEERKLWGALKLEPPEELGKRVVASEGRKETASTEDYLGRKEWREGLRYLSQWETMPRKGG